MREDRQVRQGHRLKLWHVGVLLVATLVLAFGIFRVVVRARLQSRIEAVAAAGYPTTFAELDAYYGLPVGAENAADYVTAALSHLVTPEGQGAKGLPLFDARVPWPGPTQRLDEQTLERIGRLVTDNAQAFSLLSQAASIPKARYPIDLTLGNAVLLSHLSPVYQSAQLLALDALWWAQRDEPERATQAVVLACALARSLLDEPTMVSQLSRATCAGLACDGLEQVLNRTDLTDEQLVRIETALMSCSDPNVIARGLAGEQCFIVEGARDLRNLHVHGSESLLWGTRQALGLLDPTFARYLDRSAAYIEIAQSAPSQRTEAIAALEAEGKPMGKGDSTFEGLAPIYGGYIAAGLADIARLAVARTVVAVQRYRLAHGRSPDALSDLVPDFLAEVPTDPFDGQPLRYRSLDSGFVVYCIGPDRTDNGGRRRDPKQPGPVDLPCSVMR